MKEKIAVIGAGSWGTALAVLLAEKQFSVNLWTRFPDEVKQLVHNRENTDFLPGIHLPDNIVPTCDFQEAVAEAEIVFVVIPSHAVRGVIRNMVPYLNEKHIIVSAAKGIENGSLLCMTQVIKSELPQSLERNVGALSGPNLAKEVSIKLPTTTAIAFDYLPHAQRVQEILMSPYFRVYTNPDVRGVELGGALKNIIALAAGITDGLGFGDNTKAALMTRGLAEISRLGIALGAQPLTFAGLAGVGDLIATCSSPFSRNHRAGIGLGQGKTLDQVLSETNMVVEGVKTTAAARDLGKKNHVEMPITNQLYKVLYEDKPAKEAVLDLMLREAKEEMKEIIEMDVWVKNN